MNDRSKYTLNSVTISAFIASFFILTVSTFADDSTDRTKLGGGYTCDTVARLIYKGNGNKTVTLAKAKDALSQKIFDLGSSKKNKKKKAALKAAKSYLKPCVDGTLAIPTPTPTSAPNTEKPSNPTLDRYCERYPESPRCR